MSTPYTWVLGRVSLDGVAESKFTPVEYKRAQSLAGRRLLRVYPKDYLHITENGIGVVLPKEAVTVVSGKLQYETLSLRPTSDELERVRRMLLKRLLP